MIRLKRFFRLQIRLSAKTWHLGHRLPHIFNFLIYCYWSFDHLISILNDFCSITLTKFYIINIFLQLTNRFVYIGSLLTWQLGSFCHWLLAFVDLGSLWLLLLAIQLTVTLYSVPSSNVSHEYGVWNVDTYLRFWSRRKTWLYFLVSKWSIIKVKQ